MESVSVALVAMLGPAVPASGGETVCTRVFFRMVTPRRARWCSACWAMFGRSWGRI